MTALRGRNGIAAAALEFTILTAAWSSEVLGAQWNEVDFEADTWTIPKERTKAGKAHTIDNAAEAAYWRGDLLEKRQRLMTDWARYCERTPAGQ